MLDRQSGELVPCTAATCPYATEEAPTSSGTQPKQGGLQLRVNRAPYLPAPVMAASIYLRSSVQLQRRMFAYFSTLASDEFSWQSVLDPSSELGPFK